MLKKPSPNVYTIADLIFDASNYDRMKLRFMVSIILPEGLEKMMINQKDSSWNNDLYSAQASIIA